MSNNLGKFFSDNYLLIIIAIVVVVVMFYPKLSEGFSYGNTYEQCLIEQKCNKKRASKNACIQICERRHLKTVTETETSPLPPPLPPIVTESSPVTESSTVTDS